MPWARRALTVDTTRFDNPLPMARPEITLTASERTGPVRIGLWAGDTRLAGWWVPFLPPSIRFTTNRQGGTEAIVNNERRQLNGFIRGWDGANTWPNRDVAVPRGIYTVTVDQEADNVQQILVNVTIVAEEMA